MTVSRFAFRSTLARILAISLLTLAVPAGGATAASPHTLDPDSMLPPLNPHFAPYDCWETGGGSICMGEVHDAWPIEVMDWFTCDGRTIYASGSEDQKITRWHLPDGRATKTILNTSFPADVFSLSPTGSEPTVTLRSRFTKHYEYLEPGVRDSRVMRTTGASLIVTTSDGDVIAREVGWIEYAPGKEDEEITDYRGPKDLVEDFDGFVNRVCQHLLGED
jgi:hypothetical protein